MPESIPTFDQSLALHLLNIGAVTFSPDAPFTWSSGLKSPIYCDNRLTMGFPEVRSEITQGFLDIIKKKELIPDLVVGTATAGIPHAAWLASELSLPMAYVRSSAKTHGRENRIEGRVSDGESAIVIEDLISTGQSSVAVVKTLQQAGVRTQAVLAIFSYELSGVAGLFEDISVPLFTLTRFETLLHVAREHQVLTDRALSSLRAWRDDPIAWSQSAGIK